MPQPPRVRIDHIEKELLKVKKKYIILLAVAVALIAAFAIWKMASPKQEEPPEIVMEKDPNDLTEDPDEALIDKEGNGIAFEEEDDEAVLEKVNADVSDYFGEWEATSDMAQYLYGNVDITVKDDGTWEADITEEALGGTWEDKGDHLHMNDTKAGLFSFDLAFEKGGKLIMIDTDSDDEVHTVLTKKK